jgi:hypothetical protein
MTDVVTDARNDQSEDVHRSHQRSHPSLFDRSVPPPFPSSFSGIRVVVVLAEKVEWGSETHPNEEGVTSLSDVRSVGEVVVSVSRMVR